MPSNNRLLLLFISCTICWTSCINYSSEYDHPAYFKTFLTDFDSSINPNKEAALLKLDAALKAFGQPGPGDMFEVYYRKRDYYYYVKKNYIVAMLYADSMLLFSGKKLDVERFAEMHARALFYKGDSYYKLKRYNDAFQYYSMAKQTVLTHVKNKCSLVEYDSYNGYLFYMQAKYDSAITYFYSDYIEQLKCTDLNYDRFVIIQRNLNNIGDCFLKLKHYDSAAHYFQLGLDFIEKNAGRFPQKQYFANVATAVIYGNQAQLADETGNYKEVERLYKQSIQNTLVIDTPFTLSTQVLLAGFYLKNNELHKADSLLDQLEHRQTDFNYDISLLRWFQYKTDYYSKLHQPQEAFDYLTRYTHVKDSLEARDKKFAAMDINKEFESLEQKALNELLQKDNRQKTIYLMVAVIVSAMAIAIALLILHNLKRSSKHVKEVDRKNEELQKAFSSLEQSQLENNRIMRVVAHDLKNPISAMRNLLHSLLKHPKNEEQQEIFELMHESCNNSIKLINDLLSRKSDYKREAHELVNVETLLQHCVELQQARADEKDQRLYLKTAAVKSHLNAQKLWRVFSNLISNAIKFSPAEKDIHILLEKNAQYFQLSVKDQGIGIPPDLQHKIFSMPEEVSRPGTWGEESHGLGLSISRKIIEEYGGRIWFESKEAQGTVFYIEMPAAE